MGVDATKTFALKSPLRRTQSGAISNKTRPVSRLVAARGSWRGSRGHPLSEAPLEQGVRLSLGSTSVCLNVNRLLYSKESR